MSLSQQPLSKEPFIISEDANLSDVPFVPEHVLRYEFGRVLCGDWDLSLTLEEDEELPELSLS